jgi:hypothetical protein
VAKVKEEAQGEVKDPGQGREVEIRGATKALEILRLGKRESLCTKECQQDKNLRVGRP